MSKIKDEIIQTQEEYYENKLRNLGIDIKNDKLTQIKIRLTEEKEFCFAKNEIYNINEFGIQFKERIKIFDEEHENIYTIPYGQIMNIKCSYEV